MTDAMVQQISAALSQRAVLVAKTPGAMHLPIPDTPSPPPARRRMEDTAEDVRRDLMGIIEKLQKKVDGITVDSMLFQTDIVKRLDENKTFTLKTAQTMVETSAQDVRAGIAKEILDPERFSKHITGHDAPILQPLVEGIMDAKIKLLNANISALNNWVRGRNERDVKVDGYLEDLYAIRPQEGDQVKSAFRTVADELKHLRAMAQPGRDPTGAPVDHSSESSRAQATTGTTTQATNGATQGGSPTPAAGLSVHMAQLLGSDLQRQIDLLKQCLLPGKCHCNHVEVHEVRVNIVEQQVAGHTEALRILDQNVRLALASMTSSSSGAVPAGQPDGGGYPAPPQAHASHRGSGAGGLNMRGAYSGRGGGDG